MLDLTKYAPYEPLTLKIGDWEITSPVPNTRTGMTGAVDLITVKPIPERAG